GPVRRVRSRAVVNAAGPWVDVVRARARALSGARLHLTKGIHLVVRRDRLPVQHIVVMQARDRRSVFAVPHGDFTYLGTTDTDYGAPTAYPEVTSKDAAYLFEAAQRTFAGPPLTSADVVATWAGLRPLLHEEGKSPSEISRRDEIMEAENGLVSIAGGKLTTHRRMAERVVDLVCHRLGVTRPCRTETVALPNGEEGPEALRRLGQEVAERLPQLRPPTGPTTGSSPTCERDKGDWRAARPASSDRGARPRWRPRCGPRSGTASPWSRMAVARGWSAARRRRRAHWSST